VTPSGKRRGVFSLVGKGFSSGAGDCYTGLQLDQTDTLAWGSFRCWSRVGMRTN
jgi:hypothetical protein